MQFQIYKIAVKSATKVAVLQLISNNDTTALRTAEAQVGEDAKATIIAQSPTCNSPVAAVLTATISSHT